MTVFLVFSQEKENLANLAKKYSELTGALGFPVSPISMKEVRLTVLCVLCEFLFLTSSLGLLMCYGPEHFNHVWLPQKVTVTP